MQVKQNGAIVHILLGTLSIVLAVMAGLYAAETQLSAERTMLIGIVVVFALPLTWRFVHGGLDPFDPLLAFSFMYVIIFVVRPFAVVSNNDFIVESWFGYVNIKSTFDDMVALALLGALAFVIGYEISLGRRLARSLPSPPSHFHHGRVLAAGIGFSALGSLLYAVYLFTTGSSLTSSFRDPEHAQVLGQTTGYFIIGPYLLLPAGLSLFFFGNMFRNPISRTVGLFVMIMFSFLTLSVGHRLPMMVLLGGLVTSYYVHRGRRPRLLMLLVLGLAGLIASSFVLHMRTVALRGDSSTLEVLVRVVLQPEAWISPLTRGGDNQMAEMFAVVLAYVPEELPLKYGMATVGEFVVRPIPRLIWPDKPLVPNLQLIQHIWPEGYRLRIANPEFTSLTAFYWDFAAPGIIVGMMMYGVVARCMYEYFKFHEKNVVAILLLSVGIPLAAFSIRHNPVDNILRWVFMMAPILVIFWFGRSSMPDRQLKPMSENKDTGRPQAR